MTTLPLIIQDLALILIVASVVSVIFKILHQPTVLGYIVAGLIVGPRVALFPTVQDQHHIHDWGEIGVIVLLFALGLDFSFRKLARVGPAALMITLIEVVAMVVIGYATGFHLGWAKMDSIFLGGILAISSTTIIIRAFDELNLKSQRFVHLVLGVLIIEDLVAILLLGVLSTIAISREVEGATLVWASLRLIFFLTLWFTFGMYVIPKVLKYFRPLLGDEALMVVALGLCFLMVMVVNRAGFSPALGAFIMGSILAETREVHHIARLVAPIRDLFAAIFFVSVGLAIDPQSLFTQWRPILLITVVVLVGKILSTSVGALVAGQPLKRALQTGLSLAQIGEFSFVIASLGQNLRVTSSRLYPIAVGVAALTTFTTPYLIRSSAPLHTWLERHLPQSWLKTLTRYGTLTEPLTATEWLERLVARHLPQPEQMPGQTLQPLAPWDAHLTRLEVSPDTPCVGQTLEELKVRERFGVTIAMLERGHQLIPAPTRHDRILPYDQLSVIGTDDQIEQLQEALKPATVATPAVDPTQYALERVQVTSQSELVGKSIHDSKIREKTQGLVVGIERNGKRLLNPDSQTQIASGDTLWIVGHHSLIQRL